MSQPLDQRDSRSVVEAVTAMATCRSVEELARLATSAARRLVGADAATFILRDGTTCRYVEEDSPSPLWKGQTFPVDASLSGWTIQYAQQVDVPDVFADMRAPQSAYAPTFVKSLLMTPMRGIKAVGAIGAYWRTPHTCTPEQAGWLQALADGAAVALDTVRVRAELDSLRASVAGQQEPVVVCAWTKRVRHEGEWLDFETYLTRRFGLQISHGMSEDAERAVMDQVSDAPSMNVGGRFLGWLMKSKQGSGGLKPSWHDV